MMNTCSTLFVVSALDRVPLPTAPICNPVIKRYHLKRDINLNVHYVLVGEENVNEYINSFADGCSLQSLLSRCSLMHPQAKFNFLQQITDGVSADLTKVPNDGTEAFIMLRKLQKDYPDVFNRFVAGDSFDTIVKDIVSSEASETVQNNVEKGDMNNGSN